MTLAFISQIASFVAGLIAVFVLGAVNKDISHSKTVLILLLIAVTATNLNGVAYDSGWYAQYPQFHKWLYPFSLLIAPCSYIYIRSVLRHEYRFQKYDVLLLIPSFLYIINMIPYYTMPLAEKKEVFLQYYQSDSVRSENKNGYLPPYLFGYVRFGWSLIFILLNYRLIRQFKLKSTSETIKQNSNVLRWIKSLNFTLSLLLIAAFLTATLSVAVKNDFHLLDLAMGALGLVISLTLFTTPNILYGIYSPSSPKKLVVDDAADLIPSLASTVLDLKEANIDSNGAPTYREKIDRFFHEDQPFLKHHYSMDHLSSDLKTPRYLLSAFINREYNMGFRELLNRHRIQYLLENIHKEEWSQFTLEAIAEECGFSNRTTFINHFKEVTGKTPSAYLSEHKPPSD